MRSEAGPREIRLHGRWVVWLSIWLAVYGWECRCSSLLADTVLRQVLIPCDASRIHCRTISIDAFVASIRRSGRISIRDRGHLIRRTDQFDGINQCLQLPRLASFTVTDWVGNFTAAASWLPKLFGGDSQYLLSNTWTLCYEEQFYVVTGLLLIVASRRFFHTRLILLPSRHSSLATYVANVACQFTDSFSMDIGCCLPAAF